MIAARLPTLLFGALAAWLLACGLVVRAAGAPVWQPYRELAAPAPHTLAAQHLVEMPREGVPIDALTDADLNVLSGAYVGESYACDCAEVDPIIGMHTADSQAGLVANFDGNSAGLEVLPGDVIWHSYWAGAKEPRTSANLFRENGNNVSLLDVSLGGRAAILRNASRNAAGLWNGTELQIEGAAILRLNLDEDWDFDSTDFRFGVPLIFARNQVHWKLAYYHLSSHVGDEFLVRNPTFTRINFSRDVLVFGASYYPRPAWRWYAETGWAFYDDEGSDPWELQFGVDYSQPGATGTRGRPFFAVNGHLREEVNFGGNLAAQAGWLWRGRTGRVLRTGLHYYNGKSSQFEFFDEFEQQIGVGVWQEY